MTEPEGETAPPGFWAVKAMLQQVTSKTQFSVRLFSPNVCPNGAVFKIIFPLPGQIRCFQNQYALWMPLLSPWVRIALRENLLERGIVPVDVVVEMNQPILQHDNSCVED